MADRPNVLLVTMDHWPGSLLGSAGGRAAATPTLDYLARLGARYARAYSECPVCIPARRSLMTGTSPRTHGDREFKPAEPMPAVPSLAQTFGDAGYQTFAVGKLHVYPQRDRIGFDDVVLMEEGRPQLGAVDDYELALGDHGLAGQQFTHGMSPNDYQSRPWHLPERFHPTTWATEQMVRIIQRRDPRRPAFWYLSYQAPHPPLVPPADYLDAYRDVPIDQPMIGDWATADALPYTLRAVRDQWPLAGPDEVEAIRRAFYATCTHIDHQLRVVIGTLREAGLLDDTIIMVTSDHGDMLGDHGLWAKRLCYESSARVPMILVGPTGDARVPRNAVDRRLVALRDVMPTLLDLAGIPTPESVEGFPMHGHRVRDQLYGEFGTGTDATRMITDERYKLIYYPVGNHRQLFDLADDPGETTDLAHCPRHADLLRSLTARLREELYGADLDWVDGTELVGVDEPSDLPSLDRGLHGVRGGHWPPPPLDPEPHRVIGAPESKAPGSA